MRALRRADPGHAAGQHEQLRPAGPRREARNYYVQFAVDEGGLFCEVVHNKYLAPEHAFTGDDVAKLLALGFEGPEHDDQNLFRVFRPTSEDDYMAIVTLARTVVTDFFGLSPRSPLQLRASWGSPPRARATHR